MLHEGKILTTSRPLEFLNVFHKLSIAFIFRLLKTFYHSQNQLVMGTWPGEIERTGGIGYNLDFTFKI